MMQFFLMILLVLSSGPAYGEWVKIEEVETFNIYIDYDTIRHTGKLAKMWELYDFKTRQTDGGTPYLSSKGQREYDCEKEQSRTLAFHKFAGQMGLGEPVYSSPGRSDWAPVVPGSVGEMKWQILCEKK
jgi:hypothetical protein